MMMSKTFLISLFVLALESLTSSSFIITPTQHAPLSRTLDILDRPTTFFTRGNRVLNAGFGGSDSKKKKELKIKPKQQWDRYGVDLKKEKPYRVAVKAEGKDSDDWLEVGNVKSKDGVYTKAAVARQRALIAEHARRLFPLQVSTKDRIEWAYWDADENWVIVDKSVLDDENIPAGLEKIIGFEGRPDPATGYYCTYNEGKLVNSDDDLKMNKSSKKLQ